MADLYMKALESERKVLWATCRLKGLARDTPERQRIAALDIAIAEHKAKLGAKVAAKPKPKAKAKPAAKAQAKPRPAAAGKAGKDAAKPGG